MPEHQMLNAFESPSGNLDYTVGARVAQPSGKLKLYPRTISTWLFLFPLLSCAACHRSPVRESGVIHTDQVLSGHRYSIVEVDLRSANLELFSRRPDHTLLGTFEALESSLERSHNRLEFATNAGIFDQTYTPLGLSVENGVELSPLNLRHGNGNFYLQPNGVFLIDDLGAQILESKTYSLAAKNVRLATQSGPLLIIAGKTNPTLSVDSKNRRLCSGVGLIDPHRLVFILSRDRVTFFEFAEMFRSRDCSDALYLDGEISKFYLPGIPSDTSTGQYAGILAVVARN